jgi:hypothetical protein
MDWSCRPRTDRPTMADREAGDEVKKRGQLIRQLEDALTLADEIEDGQTGYLIESARSMKRDPIGRQLLLALSGLVLCCRKRPSRPPRAYCTMKVREPPSLIRRPKPGRRADKTLRPRLQFTVRSFLLPFQIFSIA